jgi:hypothetical protein
MKIALYGISRCGKDYLIKKVLRKISGLTHIKGSETLNQLAQNLFGSRFSHLNDSYKEMLRIEFTKIAEAEESKYENIIVDAHYSFPNDSGSYEVVMTESDKNLYDVFIYMNTPTDRIIANQKMPDDTRQIIQYSENEIDRWKKIEIESLSNICLDLGKELIVLDDDLTASVNFISDLVFYPTNLLAVENAKRIVSSCSERLVGIDTVVLIDCDKTLSRNDTTVDFCNYAELDMNTIREIYKGEYYTVYQFYRANFLYDTVLPHSLYISACKSAANSVKINSELIKDIRQNSNDAVIIGLTSGIADIWSSIQSNISFPDCIFGKSRTLDNSVYVSGFVKRAVVRELHKIGKTVISVGDSPIDIGMLEESDKGYIVASSKLSLGVEKHIASHNDTNIKQLSYSPLKYSIIKEDKSIWQ